ncbi:MAG TPA: TolC family protein [Chitinophagaceae bacterium]|nr:TolC family protein [Chitinophagaceae bacterium]
MRDLIRRVERAFQLLGCFIMLLPINLRSQSLTLDQAYDLARQHYPLAKQKDLIRQTAEISIENLNKGYLPQILLTGQATYQSAVTEVNIPAPGIIIEPLDKDQYKALVADLNQVVYDGGLISSQKQLQKLSAAVEEQKIEVELYKLIERINQVYLSELYIEEQIKQVQLVKEDLNNGIKRVDAQVRNGTAFRSNLDVLKAELLKTDQRVIELRATRKGLMEVLGLLINQTLAENTTLSKPQPQTVTQTELRRPEIKLYADQSKFLLQQQELIQSRTFPRISLFAQGGYAKPGLNFFKNSFDWYYVGGVRVNWSLSNLYTSKKERQLANINSRVVDLQKETFVLNTNTQLRQQQSEIEKLEQLIATDQAIIDLRKSVKDAAAAQLENGVITSSDYLRELNAEDQAKQALITHQLQLLQAQINYQTILGK